MNNVAAKISKTKLLLVLFGFPIISYLLSFLLLKKNWFVSLGVDFFIVFWVLVSFWYIIQIGIILKLLNSSNLSLKDIGYTFDIRKTSWFILGYLVLAFSLFAFVEFALASANITPEDLRTLSDFSNITPKTTGQRIIFIFAGLVAGLSEEIVYRGFAIQSLISYKINKWIAVLVAAIPFVFQHGLKSVDQFWWFFIWGLSLGAIYILCKKRLFITIIIHWIIILTALLAILQLID